MPPDRPFRAEPKRQVGFFELSLPRRYAAVERYKNTVPEYQQILAAHEEMRATQAEYNGVDEPQRFLELEKRVVRGQFVSIPTTVDQNGVVVTADDQREFVSRADVMVGRLWNQGYFFDEAGRDAAPDKSQFAFEHYCMNLDAGSVKLSMLHDKAIYELFKNGTLQVNTSGVPTKEINQKIRQLINGYFYDDETRYRGTFAENVFHSVLLRLFDVLDPAMRLDSSYAAAERLDVDILARKGSAVDAPLFGIAFANLQRKEWHRQDFITAITSPERQAACQKLGIPYVVPVVSPKISYEALQTQWEKATASGARRTTPDQLLDTEQCRDIAESFFTKFVHTDGSSRVFGAKTVATAVQKIYAKK